MTVEKVRTGITGLDSILHGGYLKHCPTLLKGGPGAGKTIFTLLFACQQIKENETVIYVTCDETPKQLLEHMDALGLSGTKRHAEKKITILDVKPEFNDGVAGEYDLSALLLRIEQARQESKSDTLIIDSLQSLLLGLNDYDAQTDLLRLFQWTRDEKITVLTTIAESSNILNTHLFEEYIVDCAIKITQELNNNLMTRYLRIIKFRGSSHGTNRYPFSINQSGVSLIPITSTKLDAKNKVKYLKTGIADLDKMLNNKGYQNGSILMFSGRSGTAKTILAATLTRAAIEQGKKTLYVSFEESPNNLIHHLKSVGIDFAAYIKDKTLGIDSRRSVEMGLEDHIISIINQVERENYDFLVLDPISSFQDIGSVLDIKMLFIRFISNMKAAGVTMIFTELLVDAVEELSQLALSSMTDTWVRLRQIEQNGEFNRMLYISKSRGTRTSNQVKEFLITNDGIQIEDPYVENGKILFGSEKETHIIMNQGLESQHDIEIKLIDKELNALEKESTSKQNLHEIETMSKRNALISKRNALLVEGKRLNELKLASKKLRE